MNSEAPENPYEPPKAEITISPLVAARKVPASTKWLFVIILFGLIGFIVGSVNIVRAGSPSSVIQMLLNDWMTLVRVVLGVTVITAMLTKTKRLAYLGGTFIIPFLMYNGFWQLYVTWKLTQRTEELVILVILMALMLWLFLRFTFGQPSRTYYGIISAKQTPRNR